MATTKQMADNTGHPTAIRKTRIFVVDDHELIRFAMIQLIQEEPDLEVCGEARNARSALKAVRESPPNVAIIDISLSDGNGLELVKQIHAAAPDVRIIVCSLHDETLYAERVIRAGGMGYVSKQQPARAILSAIRTVLDGKLYLSREMTDRLVHQAISGNGTRPVTPIETLSDRELEVFELIGDGLSVKQIARQLHLSPKTVEYHREHIKQKLGAESSADVLRLATVWSIERA